MGILRNGILGTITGKVSGVVGSTWKGRNTLRAYAKPGNPNTASQQTQRGLFSFVVSIASLLLGTIITDFWNPFATSISGFNDFVKRNLLSISSNTDYAGLIITRGSLEPANIGVCHNAIPDATHVSVNWDESVQGNGLLTDSAYAVVIDKLHNVAFVSDGSETRDDEQIFVDIGIARTTANLVCYVFFTRGSGSSLMVSNSAYAEASDL